MRKYPPKRCRRSRGCEHEIETQKQTGALKSVNAAYRAYRLEASARGEPAQRYVEWMDRYKANLLREIATRLR